MAARCRGGGGGKGAPIGGPSTRSSTRVCGRETAIGPHHVVTRMAVSLLLQQFGSKFPHQRRP